MAVSLLFAFQLVWSTAVPDESAVPEACHLYEPTNVTCQGPEESDDEEEEPSVDIATLPPFTTGLALLHIEVTHAEYLDRLPRMVTLDVAEIGRVRIDLAPLLARRELGELQARGDAVQALAPIGQETTLRRLDLSVLERPDLSFIADLVHLEHLTISAPRHPTWGSRPWPESLTHLKIELARAVKGAPPEPVSLRLLPNPCHLRSLRLYAVQLTDVDALARCGELTDVSFIMVDADPLPALTGLHALERLDINEAPIHDLSALAGLTTLTSLRVNDTAISDLSPLVGLTRLKSLDLASNKKLVDLTPLAALRGLEHLDLADTRVSDLTPLAELAQVTYLDLKGTRVSNIQALARMQGLTFVDLIATPAAESDDITDLIKARPKLEVVRVDAMGGE